VRLRILDRGHALKANLMFAMIRIVSGFRASDVVKTLAYRPEFFGGPMREVFQESMRGPSAWSVGERELMAAFVSRVNACDF
jgi:hypothetical protein